MKTSLYNMSAINEKLYNRHSLERVQFNVSDNAYLEVVILPGESQYIMRCVEERAGTNKYEEWQLIDDKIDIRTMLYSIFISESDKHNMFIHKKGE